MKIKSKHIGKYRERGGGRLPAISQTEKIKIVLARERFRKIFVFQKFRVSWRGVVTYLGGIRG